MDRLAREEVAGAVARGYCTTANMYKELDADLITGITNEVMALLQSLSREAVRDEVLEEAARICRECRVLILGDPAAKQGAVMIARETGRDLARQIEALKREPNAATPGSCCAQPLPCGAENCTHPKLTPALAAPDVTHDWIERADDHGVYDCANCTSWTANLPLYKDEVCDAKERRFTDRRKARSLR